MKIKNLKQHFFSELKEIHDDSEIESFFYILTEFLINLKRVDVAIHPDFEVSDSDLQQWYAIISELKQEKPIQYITGETWFYGYRFEVNKHTLIPRPETEELVEWIISEIPNFKIPNHNSSITILDIGTGSGCIPIALKKEILNAKVFAIDVSEKALEIAKNNASENNAEVNFLLKDILKLNSFSELKTENSELIPKFDIIVSNPPYVRNLEKHEIKKNVLEYEPHLALFVEDTDALLFYRKIAQLALTGLQPNGKLFFEINQYLGKETVQLLQNLGFKNIELRKDFVGNERMICCSL